MSILSLILTLVIIGVALWLINAYIPMDGKIKKILNIVVVVAVIIYVLNVFGVLPAISHTQVPTVH